MQVFLLGVGGQSVLASTVEQNPLHAGRVEWSTEMPLTHGWLSKLWSPFGSPKY